MLLILLLTNPAFECSTSEAPIVTSPAHSREATYFATHGKCAARLVRQSSNGKVDLMGLAPHGLLKLKVSDQTLLGVTKNAVYAWAIPGLSLRWYRRFGSDSWSIFQDDLVIDDPHRQVIIPLHPGRIVALSIDDGVARWCRHISNVSTIVSSEEGEEVYCSTSSGIVETLNSTDGATEGRFYGIADIPRLVVSGTIAVGVSRNGQELVGFSGAEMSWSRSTTAVFEDLVANRGQVVGLSISDNCRRKLISFQANDGRLSWQATIPSIDDLRVPSIEMWNTVVVASFSGQSPVHHAFNVGNEEDALNATGLLSFFASRTGQFVHGLADNNPIELDEVDGTRIWFRSSIGLRELRTFDLQSHEVRLVFDAALHRAPDGTWLDPPLGDVEIRCP